MRTIERLMSKAKQYRKEGAGRSMGLVFRNYDSRGAWECRITKMNKGATVYDEQYFPTKEAAIEYGGEHLHEGETLLIMDI